MVRETVLVRIGKFADNVIPATRAGSESLGMLVRSIAAAIAAVLVTVSARAADPAAIEFFENKIRPILVQNCFGWHRQGSDC
jgi:hypothetical protein